MPALKFDELTPNVEPVTKKKSCPVCQTESVMDLCLAAIHLPFGKGIDRGQWTSRPLPAPKHFNKEDALLRDPDRTWWEDLLKNGYSTEVKS